MIIAHIQILNYIFVIRPKHLNILVKKARIDPLFCFCVIRQVAAEMAQRGPLVEQKALLAQAAAQIAEHEEDVANGNLTDSSVEWDYEAMGMTYEQLMEYFDNLKESTA